ncbi:hypothetical protein [Sandarakinorhabdus sp. DWP1-3-1]|uniref:hypothetical protein n=1 Tax=Sandarakinorhabdus sp. DWP1-3-1 TaxID=2804627 RepID=UPI003CF84795
MPDTPAAASTAGFRDIDVTFRNRAGRFAWGLVHALLYRPSPRVAHGWRCLLLRLFGASIGRGVHPYPRSIVWAPWNLVMADGSSIDDHVVVYNVAPIVFGRNAGVSQYTYLCSASRDFDRPGRPVIGAPIHIDDDAWVAVRCYIGPGVRIGARAVVGAASVVTHNVAANAVVAGSPPRLLRMRD